MRGEGVTAPVHGEHEVGLLDHLLAIEIEVWEMEKQWVLVRLGGFEVPDLVVGEAFSLRMDTAVFVVKSPLMTTGLAADVEVELGEYLEELAPLVVRYTANAAANSPAYGVWVDRERARSTTDGFDQSRISPLITSVSIGATPR